MTDRFLQFGSFRLDVNHRLLLQNGDVVPLEPKQFDTLLALVEGRGRVLSKDELIASVWPDVFIEETNLTRNISVLRRTLGEGCIETFPKRGYRFAKPINELNGEPAIETTLDRDAMARDRPPVQTRPVVHLAFRRGGALVLVLAGLAVLGYYLLRREREIPLGDATFAQLTDQPGPELYPSLAPDGDFFVYASRASGNWDIFLQRVQEGNPINLTKDCSFDDSQPSFSPDGRLIAFRSERDAEASS